MGCLISSGLLTGSNWPGQVPDRAAAEILQWSPDFYLLFLFLSFFFFKGERFLRGAGSVQRDFLIVC